MEMNGQTIRWHLSPSQLPSDVTEAEFKAMSKEVARRTMFRLFLTGNGPFPCPSHLLKYHQVLSVKKR